METKKLVGYHYIVYPFKEKAIAVPVKREVRPVFLYGIVTKDYCVYRFSIYDGGIKCVEKVVFNDNCAMKIVLLSLQIWNFRVYGDDSIGKLKQAGQCIDKAVVPDGDVTAGTGFVPTIAVTA